MPAFIEKYGLKWPCTVSPVSVELDMLRNGGRWKKRNGGMAGRGSEFHLKRLVSLLWPDIVWHKWNNLILEQWVQNRIIVIIGPASSGKTHTVSVLALASYYVFPECTTVLMSSTTKESLEMRIWGEVKKYHRMAQNRFEWLPGNLIEGRQRIITDPRSEAIEGRDFRNGLCGVACKKGQNYQGLGEYVGIKNKHLYLIGDELNFMPRDYVNAIANLNKNRDFKCAGLGNPKETTDALGIMAEPAAEVGGWDSGIDQAPGTKTWKTRFSDGVCIQLPGSDSPNLDGKLGIPLITQEDIDKDIQFYGKDSLQYTMMDEGRMPRGQGNRRVLTRAFCEKFRAMEPPVWLNNVRTKIGCLDAAYRGVGGDRCIFHELQYGLDQNRENIMAVIDTLLVPIDVSQPDPPEDQIAKWVMNECAGRGIQPENFFFDTTGRGSLMSAFNRIWSTRVEGIEFGGKPSERAVSDRINVRCCDYYSKFVTELWWSVRLIVEAGQFRGMTEEILSEGCMREWTLTAGNKTEIEPKDKMKLKSGRSPDIFDALVAGVEGARRKGFVIAKLANFNVQSRENRQWRKDLQERADKLWRSKDLSYR